MDLADQMAPAIGFVLVIGLAVGFTHGWFWSKLVRPRLRLEHRLGQFERSVILRLNALADQLARMEAKQDAIGEQQAELIAGFQRPPKHEIRIDPYQLE